METSVEKVLATRPNNIGRVVDSIKTPDTVSTNKRLKRSHRQIRAENIFRRTIMIVAVATVVLVVGIMITLAWQSRLSIQSAGLGFLWGKVWDPVRDIFGVYPFLLGTLLTSFLALIISVPFSFAVALFLGEYFPKGWMPDLLKNLVELIAAVPSAGHGRLLLLMR